MEKKRNQSQKKSKGEKYRKEKKLKRRGRETDRQTDIELKWVNANFPRIKLLKTSPSSPLPYL